MHQFAKHFTLAEARALLPKLRRLFQDIQRQRQLALRADEQLSQAVTRSGGDAGGRVTVSLVNHLHQMNRRIHRIQGLGIQIKGKVSDGAVKSSRPSLFRKRKNRHGDPGGL